MQENNYALNVYFTRIRGSDAPTIVGIRQGQWSDQVVVRRSPCGYFYSVLLPYHQEP